MPLTPSKCLRLRDLLVEGLRKPPCLHRGLEDSWPSAEIWAEAQGNHLAQKCKGSGGSQTLALSRPAQSIRSQTQAPCWPCDSPSAVLAPQLLARGIEAGIMCSVPLPHCSPGLVQAVLATTLAVAGPSFSSPFPSNSVLTRSSPV